MMASASRITSEVRPTDAPSGNCTTTKMAPWSSSGKNPVGVIFARLTTPSAATATIAIPITEKRTIFPTMAP